MTPIPGKRADHQGIRVQLLGEVELASERGHPHQFLSLGAPPPWGRRPALRGAAGSGQFRLPTAERHRDWSLGPWVLVLDDFVTRQGAAASLRFAALRCSRLTATPLPGPPCTLAVRDLAPPGDLTTQMSLPFEFGSVEMQYESYRGTQVCTG